MKCPGIQKPIAAVDGIQVHAGTETKDSRLEAIDLRGLARMIEITVRTPEGELLKDRQAMVLMYEEGIMDLRGMRLGQGSVRFPTSQPVDLRVFAPGYEMAEAKGVMKNREIQLESAPVLRLRVRWPYPLPEGIEAGVYLEPRPDDISRRAMVSYSSGSRTSASNAMAIEVEILADGTATARPNMRCMHALRLTLRRKGGRQRYVYGISPRQVQVGADSDSDPDPVEIEVSKEALKKALEQLDR